MPGDFVYSQDIDNGRYRYETAGRTENNAKRFLLIASALICGLLVWLFAVSPACLNPVKTEIKGFPGFTGDDVLGYAGIVPSSTYAQINTIAAEERLLSHYMVESAKVVKQFPDRLSIFLEQRRAVAVTFAAVNGRTQPVYFDRNGVVIRAGRSSGEMPPVYLPVISGILEGLGDLRLGSRLPAGFLPFFSSIGAITDEDPKIWQAVSEIAVVHKVNGLYDLVLYPIGNSIRLRMGSDITKEKIYYALLMFDICRQLGGETPDEIDVRSGLGVY